MKSEQLLIFHFVGFFPEFAQNSSKMLVYAIFFHMKCEYTDSIRNEPKYQVLFFGRKLAPFYENLHNKRKVLKLHADKREKI